MKNLFTALRKIGKSSDVIESKTEKKDKVSKPYKKVVHGGLEVLYNPIEGEIIDLSNVPEGAFSGKLLGDGFAVLPTGSAVYSPADGEVIVLFPTKHAIVILTEKGLEVLIHVGINTSSLNGEGFTVHVEKGDKVKEGDLLITFDNEIVKKNGKSLISPIIITNTNVVKKLSFELGNKEVLEKAAEIEIL